MIFRYDHLHSYPRVFRSVIGLTPLEFNTLLAALPDTRKAKADAPTMLSESYDFFNTNDATGWVLETQAALSA